MDKLTSQNFDQIVNQQKGLFVIKFFSPTCGPCKTMTPVVKALEENNPTVKVFEIDTSESPELAAHFEVRGVPSICFCEGREILYRFTGLTSLGDMQFVVDNIDDTYFREHGEFVPQKKKKDWGFIAIIALAVLFFILLFALS